MHSDAGKPPAPSPGLAPAVPGRPPPGRGQIQFFFTIQLLTTWVSAT